MSNLKYSLHRGAVVLDRVKPGKLAPCAVVVSVILLGSDIPARAATITQQNGTNVTVPCDTSQTSTIVLSPIGTITDVNVINVTHTNPEMGDITMTLTDPSGTVTVVLKDSGDGGVGDGMFNIDFDDSAASPFPGFQTNGTCNSDKTYQPHGNLSDFNGLPVNGTWTLTVSESDCGDASDCDCDGFNVGSACSRVLDNWGLEITYDPPPSCDTVPVASQNIGTMQTIEACRTLTAGPSLEVSTSLGASFYAGEKVEFLNGVVVNTNAQLTVGVCDSDLCSTGVARDGICSPCVSAICFVDPFCCNTSSGSWDGVCVSRVGTVCSLSCS